MRPRISIGGSVHLSVHRSVRSAFLKNKIQTIRKLGIVRGDTTITAQVTATIAATSTTAATTTPTTHRRGRIVGLGFLRLWYFYRLFEVVTNSEWPLLPPFLILSAPPTLLPLWALRE